MICRCQGQILSYIISQTNFLLFLFQNLIKFTKAGGGDCTELMRAVSMLSDICREVENIMLLDNMQGWENREPANSVILHVSLLY